MFTELTGQQLRQLTDQEIFDYFITAPEPVSGYVMVGAELGQMMISRNREPQKGVKDTNRHTSRAAKNKYTSFMVKGQWLETPEGVGFNVNGNMVDGAHRIKSLLDACVLTPGFKLKMLVCGGLPVNAKRVIDMGRVRTPAQLLSMEGEVDVNVLQGVVRLINCYYHVPFTTVRQWDSSTMTSDEMFAFLNRHPTVRDYARAGRRMRKIMAIPAAAASFFLVSELAREAIQSQGKDLRLDEEVRWFNAKLLEPTDLQAWEPVYRLERFFTRNPGRNRIEQLAHWIRAFNAHLADDTFYTPYFREGQDFPRLTIPPGYDPDKRTVLQQLESEED